MPTKKLKNDAATIKEKVEDIPQANNTLEDEIPEPIEDIPQAKDAFEDEIPEPSIDQKISMLEYELDMVNKFAKERSEELRKKIKDLKNEKEMQECMESIRTLKRHLTSAGIPENMQNDFIMDTLRQNLNLPISESKKLMIDRDGDMVDSLRHIFGTKNKNGEFRC